MNVLTPLLLLGRKLFAISIPALTLLFLCSCLAVGVTRGYYGVYNIIEAPGPNTIIIASAGLAPFTSIVDLHSIERIAKPFGAKVIPVYIVAALIKGHVVLVRGVSELHCLYCCAISRDLARRLGVEVGEYVGVVSPFNPSPVLLKIVAPSNTRGTVWVSTSVARLLRYAAPSQASAAIIVCSSRKCLAEVSQALEKRLPRSLLQRLIMVATRLGRFPRALSEAYTVRLGLPRHALLALDVAIAAITLFGSYALARVSPSLLRTEIYVLEVVGAPRRGLYAALSLCYILSSLIALAITFAILSLAPPTVSVLGLSIRVAPSIETAFTILAITVLTTVVGCVQGCKRISSVRQ